MHQHFLRTDAQMPHFISNGQAAASVQQSAPFRGSGAVLEQSKDSQDHAVLLQDAHVPRGISRSLRELQRRFLGPDGRWCKYRGSDSTARLHNSVFV